MRTNFISVTNNKDNYYFIVLDQLDEIGVKNGRFINEDAYKIIIYNGQDEAIKGDIVVYKYITVLNELNF